MNTKYKRVIPRDLFNESKLLKCLGRLTLIIHDSAQISDLLNVEFQSDGFEIAQDGSDGGLVCTNLDVFLKSSSEKIELKSMLNSKENYPLIFNDGDFVFNDDGSLSEEFLKFIKEKNWK